MEKFLFLFCWRQGGRSCRARRSTAVAAAGRCHLKGNARTQLLSQNNRATHKTMKFAIVQTGQEEHQSKKTNDSTPPPRNFYTHAQGFARTALSRQTHAEHPHRARIVPDTSQICRSTRWWCGVGRLARGWVSRMLRQSSVSKDYRGTPAPAHPRQKSKLRGRCSMVGSR